MDSCWLSSVILSCCSAAREYVIKKCTKCMPHVQHDYFSLVKPRRTFTICQQKPKIPVGNSMVQLIPSESFWKRWKPLDVILFSRFNRNNWKNPVPFVNSHSTRFTSASFPAFRQCKCSRHFHLLFFPSSLETRAWRNATPGKSSTITSIPFQPDFQCKWKTLQ